MADNDNNDPVTRLVKKGEEHKVIREYQPGEHMQVRGGIGWDGMGQPKDP